MGVKASDVVSLAVSCIGIDKRKVIDKYNSYKPLALGVTIQYDDFWCDVFLSYLFIMLNAVDLIGGTECGVERHIQIFKHKGIWNEDGTIKPKSGDIICYNWDDSTQPNDGFADHIGMVEKVEANQITLIEGNFNDAVARRTIPVGWGYIRGYAQPKYDAENNQVVQNSGRTLEKKHLYGIDISSHQSGINTQSIEADFIIVKATQGNSYTNPEFRAQIDGAIKSGKIVGLYHYATGIGVDAEVNYFLDAIKDYIGKAFVCLDWETSTNPIGANSQFWNPNYAKRFMDKVREKTGLISFLYGSKDSCCNAMDWSAVKYAGYPLWGAQYKDYNPVNGYQSDPWQSARAWGAWGNDVAIHQYTSMLYLSGYGGNLDGNICYLTAERLKAYTIPVNISYRAHVQTYGWMAPVKDGVWAGTIGASKRLEAIKITPPEGVELEVTVHIQDDGDRTYKSIKRGVNSGTGSSDNDPIIGTTGESKRIEGISIRCTKNTTGLRLLYQGHCQYYGDTTICKEGEFCGTRGQSLRLEAIRIWFS